MSARGTAGGNQYTKRLSEKRAGEPRDAWKERVQVGKLMTLLDDMVTGRKRPNPTKIRGIEVLLDRLLPRLQATELTQVSDLDTLTRDEILERIAALLKADSTLLPELIALDARSRLGLDSQTEQVAQDLSKSA